MKQRQFGRLKVGRCICQQLKLKQQRSVMGLRLMMGQMMVVSKQQRLELMGLKWFLMLKQCYLVRFRKVLWFQ
jgi:hypothetical protein